MAEQQTGSSSLFAIFALSLLSLFLIPWTIYRLCVAESGDEAVQPWLQSGKAKQGLVAWLRKRATVGNVVLLALWGLAVVLVLYAGSASHEDAPFDPFEILQVPRGATSAEVKRAYRQLSLRFHPDKNPDPAAAQYFAEKITKAYKALTDDVARENYEKHGHPDGPQGINVNVALPEWLLRADRERGPWVLLGLVALFILVPLVAAACYLTRSTKTVGPNNVMAETLDFYFRSKFGVKELQSLARIPETLVVAMEFITLPTPGEQQPALEELRKTVLRIHPDLKDKTAFWKRRSSVVKVHMLLLAHLAREDIPPALQQDLRFVLRKAPLLLEEIVKIALLPRPPEGYGWLAPAVGAVELAQCLTMAVGIASRKAVGKGAAESAAPLLQLPHVDGDLVKKLARRGVRGLPDLAALPPAERGRILTSLGLTASQAEEVGAGVSAAPSLFLSARCVVEGEEESDIMEGDLVTCQVHVVLTRLSHATAGFSPDTVKNRSVQAYAPYYPFPKQEKWYFFLADPTKNEVYTAMPKSLLEAEAVGMRMHAEFSARKQDGRLLEAPPAAPAASKPPSRRASKSGASDAPGEAADVHPLLAADEDSPPAGQLVELRFRAPKAGKYELALHVLSDCWVSCDRVMPLKLRVAETSRAEREGRAGRGKVAPDDELALEGGERDEEGEEAGSVEEDEDEGEGEYDSEESGTEESGSDDEDEAEPAAKDGGKAGAAKRVAANGSSSPPAAASNGSARSSATAAAVPAGRASAAIDEVDSEDEGEDSDGSLPQLEDAPPLTKAK